MNLPNLNRNSCRFLYFILLLLVPIWDKLLFETYFGDFNVTTQVLLQDKHDITNVNKYNNLSFQRFILCMVRFYRINIEKKIFVFLGNPKLQHTKLNLL